MRPSFRITTISLLLLVFTSCSLTSPVDSTPDPLSMTSTHLSDSPGVTPTPTSLIEVDPEALQGTSIQIWHTFSGATATLFTTQLAEFNTLNEWDITVYQTVLPDFSNQYDAINLALEEDSAPDLVISLPEHALAWQETVVDLNDYLHDPLYGLSEAEIEDIPAAFLAQDEVDGVQLGVPAQRTANFLIQNQTWTNELGFRSAPLDADSFRDQACAANQSKRQDEDLSNDGYGGWIVNTDPYAALSWMTAFGGSVTDEAEYQFASEANEEALIYLKGLYDNYCAYISTEPAQYEPFANRSAIFATLSLGELPQVTRTLEQAGNTDEWNVLLFPGEEPVTVVYGSSYILLESTPEQQLAAWLFTRWLLSPENQARWVQTTGLFPLRLSALDLLTDYQITHPQWSSAVELLSQVQTTPQLASWREVKFILEDGMLFIFRLDTSLENIPGVLAEMDALTEEVLRNASGP